MKLTDLDCRNAKPRDKKYKLADGNGLYLEVRPNGGRYFRWRYRYADKDKDLTIGTYPRITLAKARRAVVTAQDTLGLTLMTISYYGKAASNNRGRRGMF